MLEVQNSYVKHDKYNLIDYVFDLNINKMINGNYYNTKLVKLLNNYCLMFDINIDTQIDLIKLLSGNNWIIFNHNVNNKCELCNSIVNDINKHLLNNKCNSIISYIQLIDKLESDVIDKLSEKQKQIYERLCRLLTISIYCKDKNIEI